ncbi:hypothetical protein Q8F55_006712 [Vanrija albida]|uniref:Oxidoreductase-like domain-containing protein n=1 Tax=Vanrija albida TaxID=181172 RepID=A0ABR3PXX8_9TREE
MTAAAATATTEPDEFDVRDYIQEYADAKRLTPSRADELLEAALKAEQPAPPDPDACCGSSCCPCVQDLWREEVAVWKAVRVEKKA